MDMQQLKHVAGHVRGLLDQSNQPIGHSVALDLVASIPGLRNWTEVKAFPDRVATAALDLTSAGRLAIRLNKRFALDIQAPDLLAAISSGVAACAATAACVLCSTLFTKANVSKEHLILNAIGGRRKITGFLCRSCNSSTGQGWDAALAEQLNPLSLILGIQRERGTPPSQKFKTTTGEELELSHDGTLRPAKPHFSETKTESGTVQLQIMARTMVEAKHILGGVKRKYPQIDLEEVLKNLKPESRYPDGLMHFSLGVGGVKAGRSIVKSALALAVDAGVNPEDCDGALAYLANDAAEACFGFYYERDLVRNRPERTALHCVAVRGDPSSGQLLGYVEFYGVHRMVVSLSDRYHGEPLYNCYAVDPIAGTELKLDVDLALSAEDVAATYRYEKIPKGSIEKAFEQVIPIGLEKSYQREKERVIDDAIDYAFKNCGAKLGEVLTPEHVRRLARLITEKMQPFLLQHISSRQRRRG